MYKFKEKIIKKDAEGITLVALVVTIILLLILAGTAINLTLGEDGIFRKAQEGAQIYQNASLNEQKNFNEIEDYISNILDGLGDEHQTPTVPEKWDLTKVIPVLSEDKKYVPVPKGYISSNILGENTVSDGFVIYEGEEPIKNNIIEEQENRNQFVWIPVANIHDLYGIDGNGKNGVNCTIF